VIRDDHSVVLRLTKQQVLWAISTAIVLLILCLLGVWLWGVLFAFIQPESPTEKKDLVNVFVVAAAGVVATLTAMPPLGTSSSHVGTYRMHRPLCSNSAILRTDALKRPRCKGTLSK
jgi:Co/Zn/Cd efflux system component